MTQTTNSKQNPIKLIYIIGRYPELTTTFVEREIKLLRELGDVKIDTVSIRHPLTMTATLPEYKEIRESTLYLTPVNWLVFILANLYFLLSRPVVYFSTLFYLLTHEHPDLKTRLTTILHFGLGVYTAYLLREEVFDHIHVHFIDRAVIVALIVGRLLNKTYSLTAHANSIFVKQILIREKIANAKFMVTVSKYNKKYLLENYTGLDPDKIAILHPWVDITRFVPPETRPAHDTFNILSVGRLVEKKGHIYLVEACHILKEQGIEFECRFVGEGPLSKILEKRIVDYGLEDCVHLMGGQPQTEVIRLLESWADVFVLPCVIAKDGDRDGIPVALAEAMAMELPVISTDIVGISELVQPGTGFLVPPHDPASLAESIEELMKKPVASRHDMGKAGRVVVENEFNLAKGTSDLAALFREAAHSQS